MALTNSQIRVAPIGHVYVAPLGSTAPTDVTTAWAGAWTELGYIDDSGLSITPKLNTTPINSWQSATPTKELITGVDLSIAFNLQQVNTFNLQFYFFGNTFTTNAGINTMNALSYPTTDERMLGIEWTDTAVNVTNRLIIPRGMATDRSKWDINRKTAMVYGMTFEALDNNGTLFTLLSNDANE